MRGTGSDKEKRQLIKSSKGAIAFRMGELEIKGKKKDIWHVIVDPYEQQNYLTVVGNKPVGATIVRGPNSAKKTAQLLYNKPLSREVSVDIGIVDADLKPISDKKGIELTFKPDPGLSTKSDITTKKASFPLERRGKIFPLSRGKL